MIRQSHTAVIERDTVWSGSFATEPYETAWASEAIFFVRVFEADGIPADARARVQISPDGMHWCDEGTALPLPPAPEAISFARAREFGSWLRLAGELPSDSRLRIIVYLVLKA